MLELQLLVLGCGLLSASPKTFLVSTSNLATREGMDPSNKPKTGKGKIEQKDVKEQQIIMMLNWTRLKKQMRKT